MDPPELNSLTGSIVRVLAAESPPGSAAHLFSVESATDTKAVLWPRDKEAKDFAASLVSGQPLQVAVGASGGVFNGTLVVDQWLAGSRMLMVDQPALSFAQRRDYFRVAVALPIELGLVRDGGVRLISVTTTDMSQGGCSFVAREPVVEGEFAAALVRLNERPVLAVVQIVGVSPDRKVPVRARFERITPYDRTTLAAELRRHEVARVRTEGQR